MIRAGDRFAWAWMPVPPIVISRTAHRDHVRDVIGNRSEATLG